MLLHPGMIDEPLLVGRLIEMVLSKKDLNEFRSLVPNMLQGHAEKWEELHRKSISSIRELCDADNLACFGWPEGHSDREPISLSIDEFCESEFFFSENAVQTCDGTRYLSCLFVPEDLLSFDEDGLTRCHQKPLFFYHANPPRYWYAVPTAAETDLPGPNVQPRMILAYAEAIALIARGSSKDPVASDMAAKWQVYEQTLRDYLKPSKTPAWAKNLPVLGTL
ncbi:hypothetical protein CCR95_17830 [Thiocystis minor]|uniref:hypothetical protein n=1 Tax=Thiocystis minor TaxID=61597 RepID=UPI00191277C5|nr:hypothetical protein [Thiocystis minor]MBK5965885.1 hypothetical protein [Thiocystis minor]